MEFLIPVIIVIAIVAFFIWASKGGEKILKLREEKLKRAQSGKAKILGQSPFGLRGTNDFGQYQGVNFRLEVWSEFKQPYRTETRWNVGILAAPYIEIGKEVNIKIDADDQHIIYPDNIPSVEYSFMGEILNDKKK